MSDLIVLSDKQITTLNNIGVPLKGILIDLRSHNFVHTEKPVFFIYLFFNWDSLYTRLSSHYEAQSYKKRKHKIICAHICHST